MRDSARLERSRLTTAFFVFAWLLGVGLRLSFPGDIEYKGDEAWTLHQTASILSGGRLPATGMPSSAGIPNPGLSLWQFVPLGAIFGADSPVHLARGIQVLNALALTALLAYALRRPEPERGLWLWTGALAAVDPLEIILQRKIWPPSSLPLLVFAFFLAWRARGSLWGALCWGAVGALLGQLHMGGFFFAFTFVCWSILQHVRRRHAVRWAPWLVGSVLGSLPMLPWLAHLWTARPAVEGQGTPPAWMGGNPWRLWIQDSLAWNLDYSLGPNNLKEFREWPLVQVAFALTAGVAVVLAGTAIAELVRERWRALDPVRGDGFTAHNLAFFGWGLVMTALPLAVFRHYFLMVFPFESMSIPLLAGIGRRSSAWLFAFWIGMAVLSCSLLWFLHVKHGAPGGDYGIGYQFQRRHP